MSHAKKQIQEKKIIGCVNYLRAFKSKYLKNIYTVALATKRVILFILITHFTVHSKLKVLF